MATIKFPTEVTKEGADVSQLVWFLYGQPGIGKSTFFSKIPGALFLHTDPGLRFISAYKQQIDSWQQFAEYIEALHQHKPDRYKFIVVDTIDLLFNLCMRKTCEERGIEHQSDEGYGKGYEMVNSKFQYVISRLMGLPYGVAFISHSKETEIRGRTMKTNKIVPTLANQARKIISPLVDITGYAGYEEGAADNAEAAERVIIFQPSETVEAKDRTGMLPKQCQLDFEEVEAHLEQGGIREEDPVEKPVAKPAKKKKKKKRA